MECRKYTLINTGNTIVNFNYQRCDDNIWEYQVELLPSQTKNIWFNDGTYSSAEFFAQQIQITDNGLFPYDDVTPVPSPTPSPTPSVTPSVTPTTTPVPSLTPSVTPTTTLTPTPTTNRNLIISNTSTNNYIIRLIDNSGTWYLTDQVGFFNVGPGQMLYANHGTTDTNPECIITYNGSYNFRVRINGVLTSDWGGSGSFAGLPRPLNMANPAAPIDESEIVYIEITD